MCEMFCPKIKLEMFFFQPEKPEMSPPRPRPAERVTFPWLFPAKNESCLAFFYFFIILAQLRTYHIMVHTVSLRLI